MTASGFRFRLERVRALRERREEIAKQELANAMGKLLDSERNLQECEHRLAAAHAGQRDTAANERVLSAADLIARQAFVERVEQLHRHGARELERSESEVASRGAALNLAAQEHQMLQRLKDRHEAEHVQELSRREGLALDEIALDRFRRSVA
jgi:flagellar protein FliJ